MPKIKTLSSLLLFLLLIVPFSLAQVSNPSGKLTPLQSDQIWPQTLEGSHFNEFWTYHFFLNDDLKVHITFSVANFGSLKSPVSGVQLSIDRFNGQLYQLSREYSIEHLVQDKERFMFRNRAERDLWFEGKLPETHRVRINTSKDGVSYDIDLDINNIVKGFKWGDGKYQIENEQVGVFTHIPYATVNGTIKVNNDRKQVEGTVYMDHVFQNQTTTRLVDSGYRFIHHQDADNWDILYVLLPDNSNDRKTVGHRISMRDGKHTVQGVTNIESMSTRNTFGEDLARTMELRLDDGTTLRLTRRNDTEKFSVLSELGRIARRAARTFLGGEVIHFRGDAVLLEPGERPIRGSYNFLIVS